MDTTNEIKQHKVINEVEPTVQTEVLDEKELEKRAIDTIVALVDQAKAISAENRSAEDTTLYEDVDDPKTYLDKIDGHESKAREKYARLKEMKKAHFWTIGRNKAKVEQTQKVIDDIIEAVNNNANATKALFNNQVKLAIFSKKLYAIGIMGIAANRIVVREIKKRLEHASQEELDDLARRELESVVHELQQQQKLERKVDDNYQDVLKRLESANARVKGNRDYSEKKFEEINQQSKEIRNQLLSVSKDLEQQYRILVDKQEKNYTVFRSDMQNLLSIKGEEIEKELKRMKESQEWFKKDINKTLDEKLQGLADLHKQFIMDQASITDKIERQVKSYKIVAIIAGAISIASVVVAIFA